MAIPKKGSRIIVVNEMKFRWIIRHKPTYEQAAFGRNMSAAVELYEAPASTLLITFPWARQDNLLGQRSESITPRDISFCIVQAITKGWDPTQQGPVFDFAFPKRDLDIENDNV